MKQLGWQRLQAAKPTSTYPVMQSHVFVATLYTLLEVNPHERQEVYADPEQVAHLILHALQTEVIGS